MNNQKEFDESKERDFFEFAIAIWRNSFHLARTFDSLQFRSANLWLFCHDLRQKALDPRLWSDPDYWEQFLDDPDDVMKGGPIDRRDNRRGKPKKFWRWAEDEKKDEMSRRTGLPIPDEDIEKWYKQWQDEGEPDGWGRQMVKPM